MEICTAEYVPQETFASRWFVFKRSDPYLLWRFNWGAPLNDFETPIWILVVLTAMPTASAWRLDTLARRRARIDQCPKCNYDRRGIAAGVPSPECGAPPATA